MSVMQLPEKHDHQLLSAGVSKERRRPMTTLSEDDVGRVDQEKTEKSGVRSGALAATAF